VAFAVGLSIVAWSTGAVFVGRISPLELVAVLVAGAVLIVGGAVDDRLGLSPARQLIAPSIAIFLVAGVGVGISRITNPFAGGWVSIAPWMTVLFTMVWLYGTTYTTKLLDGLDGLVVGLTAIGACIIGALSLTHAYYQPDVAVIAFVLAGACLGFLVYNFHPASIFLGEGGSTLCGFLLGILAIISGGKIATVLLVLGIPATDAAFVIVQRLRANGSRGACVGDRSHLHFRLLNLGLSHRGVVLLLYVIAAAFGISTLVLQAHEKLLAIGILAIIAVTLSFIAHIRERHAH
ncbi:MAG: MraY family glycosyltransferase, partial [Candidatus Uhrbacteria bacterium]